MNKYRDALLGVAIGDALGVPVEFMSREAIAAEPVTGMREYGTHKQPMGTWRDDSALTFCLAESLTAGFNIERIGKSFERWLYDRWWTPHGKVFDIGNATRAAIDRIAQGVAAESAGPTDENAQGNGSLMRILPLVFYIHDKPINERWDIARRVSNVTHGHIHCAISCFIYLEIARKYFLSQEAVPFADVYASMCKEVSQWTSLPSTVNANGKFARILSGELLKADRNSIRSSGYVIDTLEASIWCMGNASSYEEAVLKAVNLGDDTDTTGAVVGGLAGLQYGIEQVPSEWLSCLVRRWDIEDLAERLKAAMEARHQPA